MELAEALNDLAFFVEDERHVVRVAIGFVDGADHGGDAPAGTGPADLLRRGFQLGGIGMERSLGCVAGDGALRKGGDVDTGIGQLLQLGDDAFGVVGNIERGTELDGGDFQFHGLSE